MNNKSKKNIQSYILSNKVWIDQRSENDHQFDIDDTIFGLSPSFQNRLEIDKELNRFFNKCKSEDKIIKDFHKFISRILKKKLNFYDKIVLSQVLYYSESKFLKDNKVWFVIFAWNINPYNQFFVFYELFHLFNTNVLNVKDQNNNLTCMQYFFYNLKNYESEKNVNNKKLNILIKYHLKIIQLILPFLELKHFQVIDKKMNTIWHYILNKENINDYHIELIKQLSKFINANDLVKKNENYESSLFSILTVSYPSKNTVEMLKLLKNLINKEVLINQFQKENNYASHYSSYNTLFSKSPLSMFFIYLFNLKHFYKYNIYYLEYVSFFLPLLDRTELDLSFLDKVIMIQGINMKIIDAILNIIDNYYYKEDDKNRIKRNRFIE